MKLLTYLAEVFYQEREQNFTEKLIKAMAIFAVLDKYDAADFERLKYLEENTSASMKLSLYKLDQRVNPAKKEFSGVTNNVILTNNEGKKIRLTEYGIQHALCVAIREVVEIVTRNLKPFAEELDFYGGEEDESSSAFKV